MRCAGAEATETVQEANNKDQSAVALKTGCLKLDHYRKVLLLRLGSI